MSTSSFVFLGVSGGGVGGQERSIRLAYLDDATSVCYGTVTFVRQCVVTMRRQGGMRCQGATCRQTMCRHNALSSSVPKVIPKLRVPCTKAFIHKYTHMCVCGPSE